MALSFSGGNYWYTQEGPTALDGLSTYTAMCWARPERLSGFQACFSRQSGTGSGETIWLGFNGTSVNTFISLTTAGFAITSGAGTIAAWQHIAVTLNTSASPMGRLYLNATQTGTGSGTGTLPVTTRGLMVGGNNNVAGISLADAFQGAVEDIRIYNRVLGEAELQTIVAGKGKDSIVSGLLCRLALNEQPSGIVGSIIPNYSGDSQLSLITQSGSPPYIDGITVPRSRISAPTGGR